jgi:hypothetical protein
MSGCWICSWRSGIMRAYQKPPSRHAEDNLDVTFGFGPGKCHRVLPPTTNLTDSPSSRRTARRAHLEGDEKRGTMRTSVPRSTASDEALAAVGAYCSFVRAG